MSWRASHCANSFAGTGWLKKWPWPCVHPKAVNSSTWSRFGPHTRGGRWPGVVELATKMAGDRALHLAQLVLTVHALVALFVVAGMIAIPLGARLGWPFIYSIWWRSAHLGIVVLIALQKVLGQTCFLSVWEFGLLDRAGLAAEHMPGAQWLLIRVMHWDLPLRFFTVLYLAVLAYTLVLWRLVPPRRACQG